MKIPYSLAIELIHDTAVCARDNVCDVGLEEFCEVVMNPDDHEDLAVIIMQSEQWKHATGVN